ncbi:MAG: GGDEF domain-containing protein [Campylobacterota bacterium]|nr:GGDEF domain-containing protein [Campylobacterota bacterium]
MNKKLKNITDSTINQLLNQDIIMPSQYYTTFDKNAKDIDMYIHDDEFEKEISVVLEGEFEKISQYMNQTIHNINELSDATNSAESAIQNRDIEQLMKVNSHVQKLKKNIESLENEIYKDSLTKLYNRKYLNMKFLNENDTFNKKGIMVLVDINNFSKIIKKYGQLIGDNILRYAVSFIQKRLQKESIKCTFIHYSGDKFILFFKDQSQNSLNTLFDNIRFELLSKTLKSKSGHIISISFSYAVSSYLKNDKFYPTLLNADDIIKEDKFNLKN